MRFIFFILSLYLFSGCASNSQPQQRFFDSQLFKEVQINQVFEDSKTFADCEPKKPISQIIKRYNKDKSAADFNLKNFVLQNFNLPTRHTTPYQSDTSLNMENHIYLLWNYLSRKDTINTNTSSLLPLPYPYVVPGGRFSEIYYWDSYFTMIGLKYSNREDLLRDMLNNFSYLISSKGFIPNGNRSYYLSRSQPPFYSYMVTLLAENNNQTLIKCLPHLVQEYSFWMKDSIQAIKNKGAASRVICMKNGALLNRYWDNLDKPRPESFREDYLLVNNLTLTQNQKAKIYRNIRAACESGWDFSSRWLANPSDLASIQTTSIIPVDLNCLLYHLEKTISEGYKAKGDLPNATLYNHKSERRKKAIMQYFWNDSLAYFFDYNISLQKQSNIYSLAGAFPLFDSIADSTQARNVALHLKEKFLQNGGLMTSTIHSSQQWDAPNGWAPLHWICIQGLDNYNFSELADSVSIRWLQLNEKVYQSTGSLKEKYNVVDTKLKGGGGEYPLQDGFGWTNGVAIALLKRLRKEN